MYSELLGLSKQDRGRGRMRERERERERESESEYVASCMDDTGDTVCVSQFVTFTAGSYCE